MIIPIFMPMGGGGGGDHDPDWLISLLEGFLILAGASFLGFLFCAWCLFVITVPLGIDVGEAHWLGYVVVAYIVAAPFLWAWLTVRSYRSYAKASEPESPRNPTVKTVMPSKSRPWRLPWNR